jgi:CheY-like chemotaxis protein
VCVRADPGQIEQILMNLCLNARDAMSGGGRLTIRVGDQRLNPGEPVESADWRPGHFACLSVADTGSGMSREVMAHLFEPFFTTKGRGKGTGLGLATAYGIARQHEGWMQASSEEGKGSMFRLYLPFHEAAEDALPSAAEIKMAHGEPAHGERILLVEDDYSVRAFAAKVLRHAGYTVFAAASAWEALELFEREMGNFDLIFSDVVLPDRNGIDVIDDFMLRRPGMRVILTSGYTDEKSRWPDIQRRGIPYLHKPYPPGDLLRTVAEVLRGARAAAEPPTDLRATGST